MALSSAFQIIGGRGGNDNQIGELVYRTELNGGMEGVFGTVNSGSRCSIVMMYT